MLYFPFVLNLIRDSKPSSRQLLRNLTEHYSSITDFLSSLACTTENSYNKNELRELHSQLGRLKKNFKDFETTDKHKIDLGPDAEKIAFYLLGLLDRTKRHAEDKLKKIADILFPLVRDFFAQLNMFLNTDLPGEEFKAELKTILQTEAQILSNFLLGGLRQELNATKRSVILEDISKRLNKLYLSVDNVVSGHPNYSYEGTYDRIRKMVRFLIRFYKSGDISL